MKNPTNQFCLEILNLELGSPRALANLVMALGSCKADSVTALSENPIFHYQYSSIRDAVSGLARDEQALLEAEHLIQAMCLRHWQPEAGGIVELQTDKTSVRKPNSPTLPDRTLVNIPNCKVPGNRPLDIGYEFSFVNLCCEAGRWSVPLSARWIPLDKRPTEVAVQQIQHLLTSPDLPLIRQPVVINSLDSGYAGPYYVDGVKGIDNLVSVVRLRAGSKVYERSRVEEQIPGKCPKVFGQVRYLLLQSQWKSFQKGGMEYHKWQDAISDQAAQDELVLDQVLTNGRLIRVHLLRWNDLLMRTKDGIRMHDKPLDLVMVQATDPEDGRLVFKNPLFLAAFGGKKGEISTRQIYEAYHHRYGIEPFFGFAKRNLFLQTFQTPVRQHLQNWMYVIILSVWMLFTARKQIDNRPKKWQQYNAAEKNTTERALSMAQTHKAILPYLLSFDPTPFLPLKLKPGPGRQKGWTQTLRARYRYVKKAIKKHSKPKNKSPG